MKATVMYGVGDVRVDNVPDARMLASTDAIVRICVSHVVEVR